MGWTDPSDAEFFEIKKYIGSLVLVAVNEYIPSFTTAQGTAPAVRAEVAVVDGPGAGDRYPDAMFFGRRIVPQLQRSVGTTILGRIGQGEKKAGQNAPFQLEKAGPGDADKANAYVKTNGDVESHPITQTAYAAPADTSGENWKVAGAQAQQAQGLPTPPSYPSTYTQPANVGAGSSGTDEPPF
jgi:hypothetical protein